MLIDLFSDKHMKYTRDDALVDEVTNVIFEMSSASSRFNEAVDPFEIESAIYRMKELETRYSFLIKQAKLKKICCVQLAGDVWQ